MSQSHKRKSPKEKLERMDKDPTPEEIDAACMKLQEDWSPKEKMVRRLWGMHGQRRPNIKDELTVSVTRVNME